MNPNLLIAYYNVINHCKGNKMRNGDCVLFVEEKEDTLTFTPASITDDESTENYFGLMVFEFRQSPSKHVIRIEQFKSRMTKEALRQLDPKDLHDHVTVFKYVCGRLVVMAKGNTVSFESDY